MVYIAVNGLNVSTCSYDMHILHTCITCVYSSEWTECMHMSLCQQSCIACQFQCLSALENDTCVSVALCTEQYKQKLLPGADPGIVKGGGGLAPGKVKCPPRGVRGHGPPEDFGSIHSNFLQSGAIWEQN